MRRRRVHVSCSRALLLVLVACWPFAAGAADDDPALWVIASVSDTLGANDADNRWRYWFDVQGRYFDPGSGANQWLARPGIGFVLNDRYSLWAGYARFRTRSVSGQVSDEDRWWQQLSINVGNTMGGRVTGRARLEQRSVSTGADTGLVLRLMAQYVRPIGSDGRKNFVASVEPFFDLRDTDWGGDDGLGQIRAFIGVGWRLTDSWVMNAGYQNQYIVADTGTDRSVHIGVLNFQFRP